MQMRGLLAQLHRCGASLAVGLPRFLNCARAVTRGLCVSEVLCVLSIVYTLLRRLCVSAWQTGATASHSLLLALQLRHKLSSGSFRAPPARSSSSLQYGSCSGRPAPRGRSGLTARTPAHSSCRTGLTPPGSRSFSWLQARCRPPARSPHEPLSYPPSAFQLARLKPVQTQLRHFSRITDAAVQDSLLLGRPGGSAMPAGERLPLRLPPRYLVPASCAARLPILSV